MSKKERKIIYRIEEDKIIEKRYQRFLLLLAKDFLNKKKEVENEQSCSLLPILPIINVKKVLKLKLGQLLSTVK